MGTDESLDLSLTASQVRVRVGIGVSVRVSVRIRVSVRVRISAFLIWIPSSVCGQSEVGLIDVETWRSQFVLEMGKRRTRVQNIPDWTLHICYICYIYIYAR